MFVRGVSSRRICYVSVRQTPGSAPGLVPGRVRRDSGCAGRRDITARAQAGSCELEQPQSPCVCLHQVMASVHAVCQVHSTCADFLFVI